MSRAALAEQGALEDAHPRRSGRLLGHEHAERALLEAYRSGRMPHAWIFGGPSGVGKATLAYRLARFVLAHPDPHAIGRADSLALDPAHPVFKRVAAQAHPDLLVLERGHTDSGARRTVITVEDVRRTLGFFGSTAGEGGWRVCIIDTADELQQPNAVNALLKILEEPPPRSLFLLVSHAPGRLLTTIRSRCRRLMLGPLPPATVTDILSDLTGSGADDEAVAAAARACAGSAGRAFALLDSGQLALRGRIDGLLEKLPALDPRALHALGEEISGTDPGPLALFTDVVCDWLAARLRTPGTELTRRAQVAEAWDRVTSAARDAETYNLERKPLVFSVFGWLAETAR